MKLYHPLVRDYHHYTFQFEYAYRELSYPYYVRIAHSGINVDVVPIQYFRHVGEILESVTYALSSDLLLIRNKQHPAPACCSLVEDSLLAYWELVGFLSTNNKLTCLYVLESVLSNDYLMSHHRLNSNDPNIISFYESPQINNLAEQAVDRLIKEFLMFSQDCFDQSIQFLGYMIKHSVISKNYRHRGWNKPIDRVLNAVYPVIEAKAPELALKALNDALIVERSGGHGATSTWKPANGQGKSINKSDP